MESGSDNTDLELSPETFETLLVGEEVQRLLDEEDAQSFIRHHLPEVVSLRQFHEGFAGVHKDLWTHTLKVVSAMPPVPELRWAALLHDVGKVPTRELKEGGKVTFWHHEKVGAELTRNIGERLGWSDSKTAHIAFIVEHHGRFNAYEENWSDKAIRRLIRDAGPYLTDLLTFSSGDLTTENPRKARRARREEASLRMRIRALSNVEPKLPRGLGEEVISAFHLKRGPQVRAAMDWLKEQVRSGRLTTTLLAADYIAALRESRHVWEVSDQDQNTL